MAKEGELRVWWVTNPPHEGERYPVDSIKEAIQKLKALEKRDLSLGEIVFANAGGLEVFHDNDWEEFYDEEDRDIDAIIDTKEQDNESWFL